MWYDNVSLNTDYNYISSRIRLARNFDNALFPSKLSDTEAKKLIDKTIGELSNISTDLGMQTNADILDRIRCLDIQILILRRDLISSRNS